MAKTSQAKKTITKGSKLPVSISSKSSSVFAIQRKPVPDFKKLHSKWEHKLELNKALGKRTIMCEEFNLGKSKTSSSGNKENILDDPSNKYQLPCSPANEEPSSGANSDSPSRECLSSLSISHKEPHTGKQLGVDRVKKMESVKDFEFEVDDHALESILNDQGISDPRLLYRTPSVLNKINTQVPRNSIYKKPPEKNAAEVIAAYKNLILSDIDDVVPFKTPSTNSNFRIPLRNSLYKSNKLLSFPGRFSTAAKSPGTPGRVPVIQSSTKLKITNSALRVPQLLDHRVNTRLFADEYTPLRSVPRELDDDMLKLKEMKAVERQLENEINLLEQRKNLIGQFPVNHQKCSQLVANQCLPYPPRKDLALCPGSCSTYIPMIPQHTVCTNGHSCCGTELTHITNHLSGIHLNQPPCCPHHCQQNMSCRFPNSMEFRATPRSCSSIPSNLVNHGLTPHCCTGVQSILKHSKCVNTYRNKDASNLPASNIQCTNDLGRHDGNLTDVPPQEVNQVHGPCRVIHTHCSCSHKIDAVTLNETVSKNCCKNNQLCPDNHCLKSDREQASSSKNNMCFQVNQNSDLCFVKSKMGKNDNDTLTSRDTFDKTNNSDTNFSTSKHEKNMQKTGQIFMPSVVKQSVFTISEESDIESDTHSKGSSIESDEGCDSSRQTKNLDSQENNIDTLGSNNNLTKSLHNYNAGKWKLGKESFNRMSAKSPRSHLGRALINSTTQRFQEALVDEECALYACRLKTKFSPQSVTDRDCENPLARVLTEGDAAHFIPVEEQKAFYKSEASAFRPYLS